MTIPRVFVSYSHDSQEHKRWVLEFSTRLRNVGIDASLDQWDLGPGDDIPHFMERNLLSADRVLMICTERYVEKANSGKGGVGFEKMIVTSDLMQSIDSNKVIPIIRQNGGSALPTFLRTKLFLDFSRNDQYESSIDDLTRSIHNAPLFAKPELSNSPFLPVEASIQRNGDALLELMTFLIGLFDKHTSGSMEYTYLANRWSGSRTMMDILLHQAESEGLIASRHGTYIEITIKGKMYALEHKLIE